MQSRKLIGLPAALAAALALSACGPSSQDQNASTVPASSTTTSSGPAAPNPMDTPLTADQAKVALTQQGAPALSASGMAITVNLANHGSATLSSTGAHPVNLGAHLLDAGGNDIKNDLARAKLANPLPPNGQETVTITVPAGNLVGNSVAILPVQEGIAWFDHWGAQPLTVGPFIACASDATKLCDKSGQPIAATTPASSTAQ